MNILIVFSGWTPNTVAGEGNQNKEGLKKEGLCTKALACQSQAMSTSQENVRNTKMMREFDREARNLAEIGVEAYSTAIFDMASSHDSLMIRWLAMLMLMLFVIWQFDVDNAYLDYTSIWVLSPRKSGRWPARLCLTIASLPWEGWLLIEKQQFCNMTLCNVYVPLEPSKESPWLQVS